MSMDKYADSKLRIACLQENFKFLDFWEKHQDIIKRVSDGRKIERHEWVEFVAELWNRFDILAPLPSNISEVLRVLNPFSWETYFPWPLPFEFVDHPPIMQVLPEEDLKTFPKEADVACSLRGAFPLKPSERVLLVDLSAKKSDLLESFKNFLDRVETFRNSENIPTSYMENYGQWDSDNSRFRHEAWMQIEVWRLRREKKTFAEIAKSLDLSEDSAKKAFYRAYERTQGKKYNVEKYQRLASVVRKEEIGNVCETCPHRLTCVELCPDALRFINQDHVKMKEFLFDDGMNEKLI